MDKQGGGGGEASSDYTSPYFVGGDNDYSKKDSGHYTWSYVHRYVQVGSPNSDIVPSRKLDIEAWGPLH